MSAAPEFRFPSYRQRVGIFGRTGSGKTQQAAWLLSEAHFDKQPYVIVDYKIDDLLNATDRIKEIGLNEVPKKPGLYITHPKPDVDDDAVENWLWQVWARGKTGLYFDEGYMIPDKGALRSILTQGRSKRIPVFMLSQRPSQLTRFAISEADFYSVFHLNDKKDRERIGQFTPPGFAYEEAPEYHAKWYDVAKNAQFLMKPVPSGDDILDRIDTRLSHTKKMI